MFYSVKLIPQALLRIVDLACRSASSPLHSLLTAQQFGDELVVMSWAYIMDT